jgi:hypothetical protein
MLRPHIRSRHTDRNVSPVQTGRQCCTERTITLNRLLFLTLCYLTFPGLSLAVLVEELAGVGGCDRGTADVVDNDIEATAREVGGPPSRWRPRQIQREMGDRDQVGWDRYVVGRLGIGSGAEHGSPSVWVMASAWSNRTRSASGNSLTRSSSSRAKRTGF